MIVCHYRVVGVVVTVDEMERVIRGINAPKTDTRIQWRADPASEDFGGERVTPRPADVKVIHIHSVSRIGALIDAAVRVNTDRTRDPDETRRCDIAQGVGRRRRVVAGTSALDPSHLKREGVILAQGVLVERGWMRQTVDGKYEATAAEDDSEEWPL